MLYHLTAVYYCLLDAVVLGVVFNSSCESNFVTHVTEVPSRVIRGKPYKVVRILIKQFD